MYRKVEKLLQLLYILHLASPNVNNLYTHGTIAKTSKLIFLPNYLLNYRPQIFTRFLTNVLFLLQNPI